MSQVKLLRERALKESSFCTDLQNQLDYIKCMIKLKPNEVLGLSLENWLLADLLERKCNELNIPFCHVAEGYCTFSSSYPILCQWESER